MAAFSALSVAGTAESFKSADGAIWERVLGLGLDLGNRTLVEYEAISPADICYGYAANVKASGTSTGAVVGFQINSYSKSGTGVRSVFGGATEAWTGDHDTAPDAGATLIGFEPSIISQRHDQNSALVGMDVPFKNRRDGAADPFQGLGANAYNRNSRAIQISSQARGTSGAYCGWRIGLQFTADAIDQTVDGLGIGIDMSAIPAARLLAAIRMPTAGKLTWDSGARAVGVIDGAFVYQLNGVSQFDCNSLGVVSAHGAFRALGSDPSIKIGLDLSAIPSGQLTAGVRMADESTLNWNGDRRRLGVIAGALRYQFDGADMMFCTSDGIFNVLTEYRVGNRRVIGPTDTGWAILEGAQDKTTAFNSATITLAQLGARVAALQAALSTHGLIGH
ncbi:hypothetical protein [Methylobacterium sp. J-092]|uniref:hypothetical protein n=1 Tax=Methylobacterium sp. J-092 TaxID=2836667 RepID=UPI001FB893FB|nr:hypothetical protein [Methylobacterium sp. J-092]MCJ2009209.1 hypothetical protein [Methylobacterium sp. J-092]